MNKLIKSSLLCLAVFFAVTLFSATAMADPIDDDLDEIWTTQDVPAVTGQQVFTTARRFEFALNFGFVPTDDYYNYFPIFLDVHYHFDDMWGLMLRGSLLKLHTDTTLGEFMGKHQSTIDTKLLGDEQLGDIGLMASFHPVYGKSTVETQNLARFDWGIFAGIGVVFSQSVNDNRTDRSLKAHAEGIFGTDMHIFFLDWLALRIEASLRFYHAPEQWLVPCTLSVGVSFFLPQL
ncbi:MAG: hypothetical protein IJU23_11765 [Proteobacteria bacterium]|nr:hypothetical protein [Pseudomonadota bacterium]